MLDIFSKFLKWCQPCTNYPASECVCVFFVLLQSSGVLAAESNDFSLSTGFSPVTDSCLATLKGPDQTNKRRTERVCFCGLGTAVFIYRIFLYVYGFFFAEVMVVHVAGLVSALILYYLWTQSSCNLCVFKPRSKVNSFSCQYWWDGITACEIHTVLRSSLSLSISPSNPVSVMQLHNVEYFTARCQCQFSHVLQHAVYISPLVRRV